MRPPGAALLRREGLGVPAPPRGEGVPAGPLPLPAPPRRHRAQLPRGDRVPGPPRPGARRAARGPLGRGLDPGRPGRAAPPARVAQQAPVGDAARRDRGARARRVHRRRPPRRGEGAREGADLLVPRRVRAVGPEEPAPGALEPVQRAHPQGREHPRVPDLQLDRARRVAVHRARAARAALHLLRPPPRGRPPRRRARAGHRGHAAPTRRGGRGGLGPLPDRRRHHLHRAGRVHRRARVEEIVAETAATTITERGATRLDDQTSDASMEQRKKEGYF